MRSQNELFEHLPVYVCPACGHNANKPKEIPCRAMECPSCGRKMLKK